MHNKFTFSVASLKRGTTHLAALCAVFLFSTQAKAQDYEHAFGIGSTSGEEINAMTRDAANNIYVGGNFVGAVDFDPGTGTSTLTRFGPNSGFVASYDDAGNYRWAVDIMSGTAPVYGGYGMAIDNAGDLVLTGYYFDTATFDVSGTATKIGSNGAHDAFIAKYDTAGNFLWAKGFGGSAPDYGYSIATDGANNIYVGGYFIGSSDFDPGPGTAMLNGLGGSPDAFLAKYDPNGNFIWAINVGGNNFDEGMDLDVDNQGNVYMTGYFQDAGEFDASASTFTLTSAGLKDIFVMKYDSSGNFVWAKGIGSTGNDIGSDISLDGSGNLLITGTFEGTVDFDASSTGTTNLTSAGGTDAFLAKYDTAGNFVWAKQMGGSQAEMPTDIRVDASGNTYLTGYFSSSNADFDPGAGTASLSSAGDDDIFMASYDAAGDYLWAEHVGGTGRERAFAMTVENAEYIYLAGTYTGTVDFDPSANTNNLTASSGPNDIYIAKYSFCVPVAVDAAESICEGDGYLFDGMLLTTAGTYTATFTAASGCDSVVTLDLAVDTVEAFTVSKSLATLTATTLTADYQWLDCDNDTLITGATSATFVATTNGSYAVIVTQNGCSDTSACVTVDSLGIGINEHTNGALKEVYPNPSQGVFTVELKKATTLFVFDITGEEVYREQVRAGKSQLNLQTLSDGIYYLRTAHHNEAIKLIVLH
jgi:hypothetical protein